MTEQGEILQKFLESNNLNQSEFSRRIGVAPQIVQKAIKGKRNVTDSIKYRTLKKYGYDLETGEYIYNCKQKLTLEEVTEWLRKNYKGVV